MKVLLITSILLVSSLTHAYTLSNTGNSWTVTCGDGTSSTGINTLGLSEASINAQAKKFCESHGGVANIDYGKGRKGGKQIR